MVDSQHKPFAPEQVSPRSVHMLHGYIDQCWAKLFVLNFHFNWVRTRIKSGPWLSPRQCQSSFMLLLLILLMILMYPLEFGPIVVPWSNIFEYWEVKFTSLAPKILQQDCKLAHIDTNKGRVTTFSKCFLIFDNWNAFCWGEFGKIHLVFKKTLNGSCAHRRCPHSSVILVVARGRANFSTAQHVIF